MFLLLEKRRKVIHKTKGTVKVKTNRETASNREERAVRTASRTISKRKKKANPFPLTRAALNTI